MYNELAKNGTHVKKRTEKICTKPKSRYLCTRKTTETYRADVES
jgi:ribosomal protein S30